MSEGEVAQRPLDATLGAQVSRDGFAVVRGVASREVVDRALAACPEISAAGVRDLLSVAPVFREVTGLEIVRSIVEASLGRSGFVTRAILFDKAPGANWALGFHQDVVIAVAQRHETPGWGPWSVKAGIAHVRPPASVLKRMITVRVHLDDCGAENGALEVIPGSHAFGFLDDAATAARIAAEPAVVCACKAGDAVLMRPLILHGSRKAESPSHRRVVHLEFAADPLPAPMRWREG